MKKNKENRKDQNATLEGLEGIAESLSGGWRFMRKKMLASTQRQKVKHNPGANIDLNYTGLANDNLTRKQNHRLTIASAIGVVALMGYLLMANISTISTQLVLHADEELMMKVMKKNPEALATVLNAMDVGE